MKKWEAFLWKHGILSNNKLSGYTPQESWKAYKKLMFWLALMVALLLTWYAHELFVELPKCFHVVTVTVVK